MTIYKIFQSGLNKIGGQFNKTIGCVKKLIQSKEFESINVMTIYADKDKQTLSAYDIKGKEKTMRKYKKKENARDGYAKHLIHSTYKSVCAAHEMTTSQIK